MNQAYNGRHLILKIIFLTALLVAALVARRYFSQLSVPSEAEPVGLVPSPTFNMIEDGHLLSLSTDGNEKKNELSCFSGLPYVLPLSIHNRSQATLHSGHEKIDGLAPVNIGHRFYQDDNAPPIEGPRHFFPTPLKPSEKGEGVALPIIINCPMKAGVYQVSVELVQEGVAWQANSRKKASYIDRLRLVSRSILTEQGDEKLYSQKVQGLLRNPAVPANVKRVALGAIRLLEASRQASQVVASQYLLSNAGSQYPMVWVRDLATIQEAYLSYLNFTKNQSYHWSEFFFKFQNSNMGVPDWVAFKHHGQSIAFDKNTVTSDQELWLVHSIFSAIEKERLQISWLDGKIEDIKNYKFIEEAVNWLLDNRYSLQHSCITSGHTIDWGDVGPFGFDSTTSTKKEFGGVPVCSTYAQSLFLRVTKQIRSFVKNHSHQPFSEKFLQDLFTVERKVRKFVQDKLWMKKSGFFKMHYHLETPSIHGKEEPVFALGAQVLAFEAGLLNTEMLDSVTRAIIRHQKKYKVSTISGVLFPAYPKGAYQNPIIQPYEYQNGGQWDWFGSRAILIIGARDLSLAKEKLGEIASKVIENGTFYEWEHLDGSPGAGPHFRAGAAAFLVSSLKLYGLKKEKAS